VRHSLTAEKETDVLRRFHGASRTRTGDLLGAIRERLGTAEDQRGRLRHFSASREGRIPSASPAQLTKTHQTSAALEAQARSFLGVDWKRLTHHFKFFLERTDRVAVPLSRRSVRAHSQR
jgi:hypothetical protein